MRKKILYTAARIQTGLMSSKKIVKTIWLIFPPCFECTLYLIRILTLYSSLAKSLDRNTCWDEYGWLALSVGDWWCIDEEDAVQLLYWSACSSHVHGWLGGRGTGKEVVGTRKGSCNPPVAALYSRERDKGGERAVFFGTAGTGKGGGERDGGDGERRTGGGRTAPPPPALMLYSGAGGGVQGKDRAVPPYQRSTPGRGSVGREGSGKLYSPPPHSWRLLSVSWRPHCLEWRRRYDW